MRQIGNYIIEDTPIGSGGMGYVYRGISADGSYTVALKEILPGFVTDIEYRQRIESEIEFLKKLHNNNVVKIYDHFEEAGNLYIVMEFVEGMNMEQFVSMYGAVQWQDAINYMLKILQTMQDVHEQGIVHRDIKPSNIMIRPNGDICLLDFGVAKDVTTAPGKGRTVFGVAIGTDGYMSPEQAQGMSIDHRSDVYALGCVLYFLITGEHAFGDIGSDLKMQIAIREEKFPRLSDKIKNTPPALQKVLDHAVDKNMMRRYQSCREFANELGRIVPGGTISMGASDTITVGRENCDICVGIDNLKVSRHHADISKRIFTGGEFYVYTDCSSNGTRINGNLITTGMSYNIPKGDNPQICLAGQPDCRLDISEIEAEFARRERLENQRSESVNNFGKNQDSSDIDTSVNPDENPQQVNRSTFIGAITTCFKKYAVFSGRASRAEFWWFYLFSFIINSVFTTLQLLLKIPAIGYAFIIVSCLLLLPSLSVSVRRLHDVGKNGNYIFLILIPIIGWIILLIWFMRKSQSEPNLYGVVPGYKKLTNNPIADYDY